MAQEIFLSSSSRYAETSLYSRGELAFFGITKFPIIRLDGDEPVVAVTGGKMSDLMHISFAQYGVVDYWWAIARVNKVLNPLEGLPIGTSLRIPKLINIRSALSGGGYA